MRKKKKKQSITLIEIMIVIALIGLISGALAFNMRGSMDQGRVFKTEQNIQRVHDILMMEHAKGDKALSVIVRERTEILDKSPLVKEGSKLLKDAWGKMLKVKAIDDDDLKITSEKLDDWKNKH